MSKNMLEAEPWEDLPYIKCGVCGYEWTPYAFLWIKGARGLKVENGAYVKDIKCPNCHSVLKIDANDIAYMAAWWKRFGKKAIKLAFMPRPQLLQSLSDME